MVGNPLHDVFQVQIKQNGVWKIAISNEFEFPSNFVFEADARRLKVKIEEAFPGLPVRIKKIA